MSIESAKAFIEKMKTDEDFRKEVGEKSSPEERVKFVEESGFDFSKEELETVRAKLQLTDEDLETLSGGAPEFLPYCDCRRMGESSGCNSL